DVAVVALGLAREERVSSCRGLRVEAAFRGRRRRNGELVELERRQLTRNLIVIRTDVRQVAETEMCGDRKLSRVVQARIPDPPLSMHIEVRHKSIPVRH